MQNRKLQVSLAVVLIACGIFASTSLDHGTAGEEQFPAAISALDPPTFTVAHGGSQLELSGTAASAEHESGLLQIVAEQFEGAQPSTRFEAGVVVPDRWESSSQRLLYALAAMESARAVMYEGLIEIRGVTSDADTLASRVEFLRDGVAGGATIRQDVIVIDTTTTLDALCRLNLSHAVTEPVEFRQSSSEIRTSSYAILDKVIEVANDCRNSTIAITGHSDASGDETWNRRLSLARAQAVADYIIRGGIEATRLQVAGLGSSKPIGDNETAAGRSLNRRIEFELRQPLP